MHRGIIAEGSGEGRGPRQTPPKTTIRRDFGAGAEQDHRRKAASGVAKALGDADTGQSGVLEPTDALLRRAVGRLVSWKAPPTKSLFADCGRPTGADSSAQSSLGQVRRHARALAGANARLITSPQSDQSAAEAGPVVAVATGKDTRQAVATRSRKTNTPGQAGRVMFHVEPGRETRSDAVDQSRSGITTWRQRSFEASRTSAEELASRKAITTCSSRNAVRASSR